MIARLRALREHEQGLTLIELIITSLLLALVAAVAGSVLVTSLRSQAAVQGGDIGVNRIAGISDSLTVTLRNASWIGVSSLSGGSMITARTQSGGTGGATWACAAWLYDSASGRVFVKRVSPEGSLGTPTPATVSSVYSGTATNPGTVNQGWVLAADRVTAFAVTPSSSTGSQSVRVVADVTPASGTPTHLDVQASRQQGSENRGSC